MVSQKFQTISGTGEIGTTVILYEGTTILGTTTVDGSGKWSSSVTLSGVGQHSIVARDTDVAGNVGTSSILAFNLRI